MSSLLPLLRSPCCFARSPPYCIGYIHLLIPRLSRSLYMVASPSILFFQCQLTIPPSFFISLSYPLGCYFSFPSLFLLLLSSHPREGLRERKEGGGTSHSISVVLLFSHTVASPPLYLRVLSCSTHRFFVSHQSRFLSFLTHSPPPSCINNLFFHFMHPPLVLFSVLSPRLSFHCRSTSLPDPFQHLSLA